MSKRQKSLPTFYEICARISLGEHSMIEVIVNRYLKLCRRLKVECEERHLIIMDVIATHGLVCPLDLEGLLIAPDNDFAHDVGGIVRHFNRTTFELEDGFSPRYFKPKNDTQEAST